MGNDYFRFRNFTINQDRTAMKVGTDGVLLGAWADVSHSSRVADIGTGTGLIAIMLAQRCDAAITGIEIDADAALQAMENMGSSPWSSRLDVVTADINDYCLLHESEFDTIVSNPPFFVEDTKGHSEKRNMARHTDGLDFGSLLRAASVMLKENGRFSVIIPWSSASSFIGEAIRHRLNLTRKTEIITKPGSIPKRVLMEFGKNCSGVSAATDTLLLSEGGKKTEAYRLLTGGFYLYD